MKPNDLALSINIGDVQLCHECGAKQAGVALGLSKALSQRGRGKDPGNLGGGFKQHYRKLPLNSL